ncbi:ABC transporter ATP-binding protein [Amycolatopsis sp. A1MSW2902]|uniref:ABC transporter ATP-binding protein n=1 Tax=Amycolatopsis sp. A1MSW2902 TaxID=687413 RepID=UPI00307D6540
MAPPLRRLARYLRRHRGATALAALAALAATGFAAALPLVQQRLIDRTVVTHTDPIAPYLVVLLAFAFGRFAATAVRQYWGGRTALDVQRELRADVVAAVHRLDESQRTGFGAGQLLGRATGDVCYAQGLLDPLPAAVGNLALLAASAAAMVLLSPVLTGLVLAVCPLLVLAVHLARSRIFPAGLAAQQRSAELTGRVSEVLDGLHVVTAFGRQEHELAAIERDAAAVRTARIRTARVSAAVLPLMSAVPLAGQVGVLGIGGWLALRHDISLGTFVAFVSYLAQLVGPVRALAGLVGYAQEARAGLERCFALIDTQPALQDGSRELPPAALGVELRDVHFGYHDEPVLRDVSLTIAPGEYVAVAGASGSGKSTLLRLLCRRYDATAGCVRVGGVNVRALNGEALHRAVGVLTEEPQLMPGSFQANIAYGAPDADHARIVAAARAAGVHDFIMASPDGYQTRISDAELSGGQRQRIALARALLPDPKLLLLDDPTTAVDAVTERAIHRHLRGLATTRVVATSRPNLLRTADRVVLLESGRVADVGTHEELQARSPAYRALLGDAEPASPPPKPAFSPVLAAPVTVPPRQHGLFRAHRKGFLAGLSLLAAGTATDVLLPLAMGRGVDSGVNAGQLGVLLAWVAAGAGLVALNALSTAGETVVTGRTCERVLFGLRRRTAQHALALGPAERDRGRLITLLTADIEALSHFLRNDLPGALVSAVTTIGAITALSLMDGDLLLLALAGVPLVVLATMWFRRRSTPLYALARESLAAFTTALHETISRLTVVQLHGRRADSVAELGAHDRRYRDARVRTHLWTALYFPFVELVGTVTAAVVLAAGAARIEDGTLTAGVLVAFVLYLDSLFAPVQQFAQAYDGYAQAAVAVRRLRAFLRTEPAVPSPRQPIAPSQPRGSVRFNQVRMRYPGAPRDALSDISLDVPAGSTLAVVGASGAGKSTLLKLLLRFHDPCQGQVLVDGVDLRSYDLRLLRRQIGFVPQEPYLFGRSVLDNIRYGCPDASPRDAIAAARAVGAHEVFEALSDGYATTVGVGGSALSAGQRQLVSLARARLLAPTILVLDEATANLDPRTEARCQAATAAACAGRTVILVAHRLSTAAHADRIAVLEDGRLAELGTHAELVAAQGHYTKLWGSLETTG